MPITESARLLSVHSPISSFLLMAHSSSVLLTHYLGSDMMSSPTCAQFAYPLPCSWWWLYFFSPGIFLLLSITHRISLCGVPEQNTTDGGLKRYHLLSQFWRLRVQGQNFDRVVCPEASLPGSSASHLSGLLPVCADGLSSVCECLSLCGSGYLLLIRTPVTEN